MALENKVKRFASGLKTVRASYAFNYGSSHTILGSSKSGKTTWLFQVLQYLAKKDGVIQHILYFAPTKLSAEQKSIISGVPKSVLFQHFLFSVPPTTRELSQLVETIDLYKDEGRVVIYILDDYMTSVGVKNVNNIQVEYGEEEFFYEDTRLVTKKEVDIKKKLSEAYMRIFFERNGDSAVDVRRAAGGIKPSLAMLTNQNTNHLNLTSFVTCQGTAGQDKTLSSILRGSNVFIFKWDASNLQSYKLFLKSIGLEKDKATRILSVFQQISIGNSFSTMLLDLSNITERGRYLICFNPFTAKAQYIEI